MAQIETISWTNANPKTARNQSVGFEVAEIKVLDIDNGGAFYWNDKMDDASYIVVETGAIAAANGFTPLSQTQIAGATISGFTNANPGVITVDSTSQWSFANGDTINVALVADDGTASGVLNGAFTIASFTETAITLVEDTSAYSAYVSGGVAYRVTDTNGDSIAQENKSIQGITIGTSAVGAADAKMVAVIKGQESVV